ncbi:tetrahydromethanopterin S-methyltransferase, subunit G [Candidatus Methanoperedens nitroreducens]|uniref:Tetrahydromethanopterin S-methyltransferase subunit G n=1 Tax=Candidatus Methanoperedens nitratireducens TaxID=1392998 RepID=A0A062VAD1_9EURY|nr:tetrahydromethanopterin S-methyltransferase subunit G [Candidatus Methanoperedens nitroreducens]KCZ73428.1 tetrahydromethanopterin S-methyltransferase, subunit G [Candidatus Methanoperedens nitroreducens]MDJ1422617.1 tetrahydromethanopterin S-methyltransferase subunit G [Candidatus Methanoperedens sp.]
MADKVPTVIVDPEDYKNILQKLNDIEEKIEFTSSEIHQRYGKKIGRDIGILYGISTALVIIVVYLLLVLSPLISDPRLLDIIKRALGLS